MAADPHQAARAAAMQDEMQAQLQSLARKLLDLWQDHVSALAQDPALLAQALKLMAAYSPFPWPPAGAAPTGGTGFAPFPAGQFPFSFPAGGFPASGVPGGAPAGSAPAAAAPDAGAGAVGELRRRLAELEGRLAELEGGAGNPQAKSPPSPLASALAGLAPDLQKADEAALIDALTREGHRRLDRFLDGVLSYRRYPTARPASDRPVLWREGTTLLRDYRRGQDAAAPRVLVVPSLINRYYILDLEPESSFLADLAARGYAPFVVDWDAPGAEEQGFDLTRYIAGRLEGALDAVMRQPGGPVIVIGYCMGGNLALALALRRQRDLAALACLATPWDFHADGPVQAQLIGAVGRSMDPLFQVLGEMPVDVLQSFFASLDPLSILAKFRRFADMEGDHARKFVALEDWLNDGVGLAAPVARECLTLWYGENSTALGKWLIAGEPVLPENLDLPALTMVPSSDRIVPPKSALALAERMPRCETVTPSAGHIGMMVGGSARAKVWDPLDAWLRRIAAR